jgi:hypothetical protein
MEKGRIFWKNDTFSGISLAAKTTKTAGDRENKVWKNYL